MVPPPAYIHSVLLSNQTKCVKVLLQKLCINRGPYFSTKTSSDWQTVDAVLRRILLKNKSHNNDPWGRPIETTPQTEKGKLWSAKKLSSQAREVMPIPDISRHSKLHQWECDMIALSLCLASSQQLRKIRPVLPKPCCWSMKLPLNPFPEAFETLWTAHSLG